MSTGYVSAPPSAVRGRHFCSSWASAATWRCGSRSSGRSTGSGIQTITFDAPGVGESTSCWRRPASHGRPRARGRPPGQRRARRTSRTVDVLGVSFGGALAQAAGAPVPGSRPRARARRHGARGAGARRRPGPAQRDAGAGDAATATTRPRTSAWWRRRSTAGGSGASPSCWRSRPTRDWPALRRRDGYAAQLYAMSWWTNSLVVAVHRPSHAA